jgi:N-acetylgalactosamine PTS system EIIA component
MSSVAGESASAPRPPAIIIGHGDFAAGMVSAVDMICGYGDRFIPLTNRDLAPEGIEELLRSRAAASGARVIFTDLPGGSVTMAARRAFRGDDGFTVVSGASVTALLAFVMHAGTPAEAAIDAAERGRTGLAVIGAVRAG